ncbi:MAG: GNAT family N-acetyltransferase [Bacillota bacterium]|jgi:RimJ/RimL family protein N-acetyltransferase|nr:GNAT family N-acetyltransferase [Candidatus Fermentithermobacillaceae bacterium]
MKTLLRYAFRELRMRKVILKVFGSNTRARKAYAELGFKEVGRLKRHILKDGVFEDEIYMEVFSEELK